MYRKVTEGMSKKYGDNRSIKVSNLQLDNNSVHAIGMKMILMLLMAIYSVILSATTFTPVTVKNFVRAETDFYMNKVVQMGGFGQFHHTRQRPRVDQKIFQMNRDTLHSVGVFDLNAGPLTVILPDTQGKFMSLMAINQDHYVQEVMYAPARKVFTKESVGTRYVLLTVRTLAIQGAHKLQNSIRTEQTGVGIFEVPKYDPINQKKIRDGLKYIGSAGEKKTDPEMFGKKENVDPVQHLIGTAMAWGGNPNYVVQNIQVIPEQNDGSKSYELILKDVPASLWSISVYNQQGLIETNHLNHYSFNSYTAKKSVDGSIRLQFGGCRKNSENCLPVMKGWYYTVRIYRPKQDILNGHWKLPAARLMKYPTYTYNRSSQLFYQSQAHQQVCLDSSYAL